LRTQQKSAKRLASASRPDDARERSEKRTRILDAAFAAFMESGYSETSTLEIATLAQVSKRELYALVGDKQDILIACITARATRMRSLPVEMPKPQNRETLGRLLEAFGMRLLTEAIHPAVLGMHRLAIAEAGRAPEVARVLQSLGRQPNREFLKEMFLEARSGGLLSGDPAEMSEQFMGLLWGDLMLNLLLRSVDAPSPAELKRRAEHAARALLLLHHPS
jgi:AcrR family transcriptional regulator